MKISRVLTLAAIVFISIASLALTGAYAGEGRIIKGWLVSFNDAGTELVMNTEVLGLMGPERKDVSIKIDRDVKLSICWAGECDTGPAHEGLNLLRDFDYFEAEGLSAIGREITVYYDSKDKHKIVLLRIDYPDTAVHFTPYDYISPF